MRNKQHAYDLCTQKWKNCSEYKKMARTRTCNGQCTPCNQVMLTTGTFHCITVITGKIQIGTEQERSKKMATYQIRPECFFFWCVCCFFFISRRNVESRNSLEATNCNVRPAISRQFSADLPRGISCTGHHESVYSMTAHLAALYNNNNKNTKWITTEKSNKRFTEWFMKIKA